MNNSIALHENNEFSSLYMVATKAASSGLYSSHGGVDKIFMILLAATEMGVKPFEALNGGIWNIQGKIEISARLMATMIRKARHSFKIVKLDDTICILKGTRCDNGDSFECSFSYEEATVAQLTRNQTWTKYRQDMLYARALSRLGRRLFSDVIGNCYVEGELRDRNVKPDIDIEITAEKPEQIELQIDDKILDEYFNSFADNKEPIKLYFEAVATAPNWNKIKAYEHFSKLPQEKVMEKYNKWIILQELKLKNQ